MDPSHSSLQSTETELIRTNRFRKIGIRDTFENEPGSLRLDKHSGRPVGSVLHLSESLRAGSTRIRNRPDSGSNPARTTSGEPTGCTPTQFVVNSEPSLPEPKPTNGFNIRLIRNESKEVRRFELQLLEGADARLFNSQGSDRPDRERKRS